MLATHTHDMSQQLGFTPPYDALLDMHLGSSYATDSNTDMNEAQHGGTQAQEQCATIAIPTESSNFLMPHAQYKLDLMQSGKHECKL